MTVYPRQPSRLVERAETPTKGPGMFKSQQHRDKAAAYGELIKHSSAQGESDTFQELQERHSALRGHELADVSRSSISCNGTRCRSPCSGRSSTPPHRSEPLETAAIATRIDRLRPMARDGRRRPFKSSFHTDKSSSKFDDAANMVRTLVSQICHTRERVRGVGKATACPPFEMRSSDRWWARRNAPCPPYDSATTLPRPLHAG